MPDDTVQRAPSGHADVALVRAVAAMRPGWMVLRGCELAGGDAGARARVGYALLHLDVGIALLDVLPGATTPDAPDLLRRSLDAGAFPEMFGGYPPIVHLRVPIALAPRPRIAPGEGVRPTTAARARPQEGVGRFRAADAHGRAAAVRASAGGRRRAATSDPAAGTCAGRGPPCVAAARVALARPRRVLGRGGFGVRQCRARPAAPRTAIGRASRPACRGQPRRTLQPPNGLARAARNRPRRAAAGGACRRGRPHGSGAPGGQRRSERRRRPGPLGAGRARHSGRWAGTVVGPRRPRIAACGFRSEGLRRHGRYRYRRGVGGWHPGRVCSGRRGAVRRAQHHRRRGLAQIGLACRGIRRSADARHLRGRRASASGHRSPACADCRRRRGASRRCGTRSWRALKPPPPPRRA